MLDTVDLHASCKNAPLVLILWTVMGMKLVATVLDAASAITRLEYAAAFLASMERDASTRQL